MRQRRVGFVVLAVLTLLTVGILAATFALRPVSGSEQRPSASTSPSQPPSGRGTLPRVLVLGDAYSSDPLVGNGDGWPALLADRIGFTLDLRAVDGSGYLLDAPSRPGSSFLSRAPSIRAAAPDVVVVFAAGSDLTPGAALPVITAAETRTLSTVHRAAPRARVLVIGPVWAGTHPSAQFRAASVAERRAAEAAGARYIDGVSDLWFAGRPDLVDEDGHPTDEGHSVLAIAIEPELRRAIAS